MEEIESSISEAIENINKILQQETFAAYSDVLAGLTLALKLVHQGDLNSAQKHLFHSFRILREAPPRDNELGYDTLVKIDTASKLILNQLNQENLL